MIAAITIMNQTSVAIKIVLIIFIILVMSQRVSTFLKILRFKFLIPI